MTDRICLRRLRNDCIKFACKRVRDKCHMFAFERFRNKCNRFAGEIFKNPCNHSTHVPRCPRVRRRSAFPKETLRSSVYVRWFLILTVSHFLCQSCSKTHILCFRDYGQVYLSTTVKIRGMVTFKLRKWMLWSNFIPTKAQISFSLILMWLHFLQHLMLLQHHVQSCADLQITFPKDLSKSITKDRIM